MDAKFFASLFEGDSGNGVKLGMGLTGGDFWPRVNGCRNLYRGEEPYDMDFDELISVSDIETGKMFSDLHHLAGTAYLYALREANGCGDEQYGPGAVVRAAFDSEGDLTGPGCNDVFHVGAKQAAGCRVRLLWYYCPLDQEAVCSEFRVYSDNGSGQIDFDNVIATVKCTGARVYSYVSDSLSEGRYRFCVNCVTDADIESGGGAVGIDVTGTEPVGIDSLTVGAV